MSQIITFLILFFFITFSLQSRASIDLNNASVGENFIHTSCGIPVNNFEIYQILNLESKTVFNKERYAEFDYQWFLHDNFFAGEEQATLNIPEPEIYTVEIATLTAAIESNENNLAFGNTFNDNKADFSVDLGGNQSLCDAETQTITAIVDGEDQSTATYLWNTGETTQSIEVSETGVYEVMVTINNATATASVEYIFNESPIIALGPDYETCDLMEFTLDATPSNYVEGYVSYSWSLDGTDLEQNTATINADDFGFGTYEVSVFYDDPDCNTTDDITLSLRDDISVNITSDDIDNLFCIDETVTFNASLQNAEQPEADFQWFVNDEPEGDNSLTLTNYEITSSETDQVVRLEVTIGSECLVSNELAFNLYDVDNCVISQGLSPDTTPGQNDNLDLRFLDDRSGITSLKIFNRYGQRVYEKRDYRDEFFGQSDNGNRLETGTYFYVIEFDNVDETYGQVHKGWIYITREQ